MVHRLFTQKFWHELFEAGVFLKALNSLWETAAGLVLLSSVHTMWHRFVFWTEIETIGGPGDHLFQIVNAHLHELSVSTRNFVGLYLLFHGLLNMVLAYNLYKNRLWAYPFAMVTVSIFLVYQIYRLAHTHSLILFFITCFDIAFIVLTWHEYTQQRKTKNSE